MTRSTLYTGSYALADGTGISRCTFDAATGAIEQQEAYGGLSNPSFLLPHPNGRWLFAVSELSEHGDTQPGSVASFVIDAASGALTLHSQQPSHGDHPCHLALDRTGRWLFVANYSSGSAAVYPIDDAGALGQAITIVQHAGSGPNATRQEGPHVHSCTVSPDNRFVIVADLGIDQLVVYAFDASSGALAEQERVSTAPGAGPRHTAFGPDGTRLYVANELDSTVGVFGYDGADGRLEIVQTLPTLPAPVAGNTVADLHLSPDGTRLIVSNRGHNSVAVYAIGADGLLELLRIAPCGGDWPRNFAVSPDGRWLLVANQYSGTIDVLSFGADPVVGERGAHLAAPHVSCVVFAASVQCGNAI